MVERRSNKAHSRRSPVPASSAKSLRELHAETTRGTILAAARTLFASRGFVRVPVTALARSAGVAVQTLYDAFGSKAGVILAMADVVDAEAGITQLLKEMPPAPNPRERLAFAARVRRRIRERCGDLVRAMRSGAAADPDVAALWAEGMRRRRETLLRLTGTLAAGGALRRGISAAGAAERRSRRRATEASRPRGRARCPLR